MATASSWASQSPTAASPSSTTWNPACAASSLFTWKLTPLSFLTLMMMKIQDRAPS
uniref:Uncharacterized protein n=1 Tax=Arundo donax TaxID=35708 RepID=A0A0A8Z4R7_ARUDO